jgi:hypothetical protein
MGQASDEGEVGKPSKRGMSGHYTVPFQQDLKDPRRVSQKRPMTRVEIPKRKAIGFTLKKRNTRKITTIKARNFTKTWSP